MSIRMMRLINRVAVALVVAGLLLAYVLFLGTFDSSLVASLGLIVPMLAVMAFVVARAARRRWKPTTPESLRSGLAFGAILPNHHRAGPLAEDDLTAVLTRVFGDSPLHGRVTHAERCRDCGVEHVVMESPTGEPVLLTLNATLEDRSQWIVGFFAMWTRRRTILRK